MSLGQHRIEKLNPQDHFPEGRWVWLVKLKKVKLGGVGKPFGRVVKDSYWPDAWVTVEVTDKEKFSDWWSGKEKIKCSNRLR